MTLVSIIGDYFSSVVPVFYHFKDKIRKHIIVADNSRRENKNAKKFRDGAVEFCKQHNLNIEHLLLSIDEDSFNSLEKAEKYITENAKGKLYINSTDGLSLLNTFFSLRSLPKGASIISYDIFDNDLGIIDINGIRKEKLKASVPIKDHFMLKGIKVLEVRNMEIARRFPNEIKLLFTRYFYEFTQLKIALNISGNPTIPKDTSNFPNVIRIIKNMGLLRFSGNQDFYKIIAGDLFEFFVYLTIKDLGFDDILVGVSIEHDGLRNEFDILMMKENHLHIIECKNRRVKHNGVVGGVNLENLLYKYAALKPVVDDESKAAMVIARGVDRNITENIATRAFTNNIAFIEANRYLKDNIKKFFLEANSNDFFFRKPYKYSKKKTYRYFKK